MFFQQVTPTNQEDFHRTIHPGARTLPAVCTPEHPIRRLQRTIGNRAVGRLLSRKKGEGVQAVENEKFLNRTSPLSQVGLRDVEKGDKPEGKKSKAKAPEWTRKTKEKPRLLDERKASYDIIFEHVLPAPPKGVTQLWQVVEVNRHILTDKCEVETKQNFVVDIVDIGERSEIKDQWGWIYPDDPCFAIEVNQATLGFDDQKSDFAEQTSVKVSETVAKDLLSKMAEPKGTYSGTYTFVKKKNCPDCAGLGELQKKHAAPDGELLKISGLGEWRSREK